MSSDVLMGDVGASHPQYFQQYKRVGQKLAMLQEK